MQNMKEILTHKEMIIWDFSKNHFEENQNKIRKIHSLFSEEEKLYPCLRTPGLKGGWGWGDRVKSHPSAFIYWLVFVYYTWILWEYSRETTAGVFCFDLHTIIPSTCNMIKVKYFLLNLIWRQSRKFFVAVHLGYKAESFLCSKYVRYTGICYSSVYFEFLFSANPSFVRFIFFQILFHSYLNTKWNITV